VPNVHPMTTSTNSPITIIERVSSTSTKNITITLSFDSLKPRHCASHSLTRHDHHSHQFVALITRNIQHSTCRIRLHCVAAMRVTSLLQQQIRNSWPAQNVVKSGTMMLRVSASTGNNTSESVRNSRHRIPTVSGCWNLGQRD
jgi:hypothetical protein